MIVSNSNILGLVTSSDDESYEVRVLGPSKEYKSAFPIEMQIMAGAIQVWPKERCSEFSGELPSSCSGIKWAYE